MMRRGDKQIRFKPMGQKCLPFILQKVVERRPVDLATLCGATISNTVVTFDVPRRALHVLGCVV